MQMKKLIFLYQTVNVPGISIFAVCFYPPVDHLPHTIREVLGCQIFNRRPVLSVMSLFIDDILNLFLFFCWFVAGT